MSIGSTMGVIINAGIVYQNGHLYRKGFAADLIILDMGIEQRELSKILSAYRSHYAGLFRYGTSPRQKSGHVPIRLILNQEHYQTELKKGPKSGGAWIPSGPVIDKNGRDVKLAGALNKAGLRVKYWTHLAITGNLPPRSRPLQQVEFLVQGTTWKFPARPAQPS